MAAPIPLACPKCRADLTDVLLQPPAGRPCPSCRRPVEGLVFSAYFRPPAEGKPAEAVVAAEEASCFYHPKNRAQVPCDACGRFLCLLCDVDLNGRHLCPACVSSGRKKSDGGQLENHRVLYGGIALATVLLPMLVFWPSTIITAPAAVFLAIYGWNKPQSLTGAGRARYAFAIAFGVAQVAVWAMVLAGLFRLF